MTDSSRNESAGQTWSDLEYLGRVIKNSIDAGLHFDKIKSYEDALAFLQSHNAIRDYEARNMARDGFKRAYHWSIENGGKGTVIRIISFGKDGIDQQGQGDDIYVEVTTSRDNIVSVFTSPPRR
jgi:hypothetical protein